MNFEFNNNLTHYLCPLCAQPLMQNAQGIACDNRHQFDRAKEGYVNLMPVQQKRSKDPGDNAQMIQARRRFLEKGHYQPLRELLSELIAQYRPNINQHALDIGCGEGYYTHYFAQTLPKLHWHGLDVSKIAIRYASKTYARPEQAHNLLDFCVASSYHLPFADHSLDCIIKIYAPSKLEELQRTLVEGAILITVTPADRHLYQLRALIYEEVHPHTQASETPGGFELIAQQQLHYPLALTEQDSKDLLQMTPFAWKANEAVWQTFKAEEKFHCEVDFLVSVYRKN